jgi:signal transduction histidine kinase
VISGQAQYLLGQETEPGVFAEAARGNVAKALQTIIKQAQRIHQILNELMQFARPARPHKQVVDVGDLIRDETEALADLAKYHRVEIMGPDLAEPVAVFADPVQLRTALACLLRNAIEAAARGHLEAGKATPETVSPIPDSQSPLPEHTAWASVRLDHSAPDHLAFVVEDSGPGPGPAEREHLFDPFYSGRKAGRGRGLGLATAWRLAREHGGDVAFDSLAAGPTRFVLRLPRGGHVEPAPERPHVNGCRAPAATL